MFGHKTTPTGKGKMLTRDFVLPNKRKMKTTQHFLFLWARRRDSQVSSVNSSADLLLFFWVEDLIWQELFPFEVEVYWFLDFLWFLFFLGGGSRAGPEWLGVEVRIVMTWMDFSELELMGQDKSSPCQSSRDPVQSILRRPRVIVAREETQNGRRLHQLISILRIMGFQNRSSSLHTTWWARKAEKVELLKWS